MFRKGTKMFLRSEICICVTEALEEAAQTTAKKNEISFQKQLPLVV